MTRAMRCAWWLAGALLSHAETLDRIAVTVDRHVISERDIEQDIRIAAFIDAKPLDTGGPAFDATLVRKAADRLIDQYLVLQGAALTRATLASAGDAAPLLSSIRERYPSDAQYRAALAQAGISEMELTSHLLAGLRMLRYTDIRFRPEAQVTEEAMRAYYATLHGQGGRSFEESRPQIEKLLTDQQVMKSLDDWLRMTRSEAQIVYRDPALQDAASAAGTSGSGVAP
jgi:hypothetical protein